MTGGHIALGKKILRINSRTVEENFEVPPLSLIAYAAFVMRFMTTCWICEASAWTTSDEARRPSCIWMVAGREA